MPHFGNEGGVRAMTEAPAASDARGADLLLSLSDRSSHLKTLDTPNGKGFYPLSKQVTPSHSELLDRDGRGPMLMSIHSSGYHRILPSPIKLEERSGSLVYSTGSESSSPASVEKREADSPPTDAERPQKQARTENDDSEEDNSNEEKKAEVLTQGPPPGSAPPSYYPHHSSPPMQQHYPSYPPHRQYPPHAPPHSWGNHHAPPPPHMQAYYYPHPQYYSMVPHSAPPYPPHPPPHGMPAHPQHVTPKKTTSSPYVPKEGSKDTPISSKHAEAQAEAIKSISDWQKGVSGGPRTYARCVPLPHPIPSRYWGYVFVHRGKYALILPHKETNKDVDRKLPDFPRLVNFPDYLSRGQTRTGGDGCGSTAEGKRHCVMCGQLRVCSKSANNRISKTSSVKPDAESTVHIIPRQNKGVCTACDVAVWVMVSQDGLEIKWCKGCKNFRPWAGFGEKGLATKCVRCRHRQREKYASQRRQQSKKEDDDILAAQGLSNLMGAQSS
eukprot:scaffold2366_cov159-Amphora_coffeaeformis.AAC.14